MSRYTSVRAYEDPAVSVLAETIEAASLGPDSVLQSSVQPCVVLPCWLFLDFKHLDAKCSHRVDALRDVRRLNFNVRQDPTKCTY